MLPQSSTSSPPYEKWKIRDAQIKAASRNTAGCSEIHVPLLRASWKNSGHRHGEENKGGILYVAKLSPCTNGDVNKDVKMPSEPRAKLLRHQILAT